MLKEGSTSQVTKRNLRLFFSLSLSIGSRQKNKPQLVTWQQKTNTCRWKRITSDPGKLWAFSFQVKAVQGVRIIVSIGKSGDWYKMQH